MAKSKRFTSTEIWREDWFLEMGNEYKLFWFYMLSNCDHAGIFKVNLRSFCGLLEVKISPGEALEKFNNGKVRIREISKNIWLVEEFFSYQYGSTFNINNRVHKSILDIYESLNIDIKKIRGIDEIVLDLKHGGKYDLKHEVNDGVKDKDKDKDKDKLESSNSESLNGREGMGEKPNSLKLVNKTVDLGYKGKIEISYLCNGSDTCMAVDNFLRTPMEQVIGNNELGQEKTSQEFIAFVFKYFISNLISKGETIAPNRVRLDFVNFWNYNKGHLYKEFDTEQQTLEKFHKDLDKCKGDTTPEVVSSFEEYYTALQPSGRYYFQTLKNPVIKSLFEKWKTGDYKTWKRIKQVAPDAIPSSNASLEDIKKRYNIPD